MPLWVLVKWAILIALVLGFAVWELISLRREQRRDRLKKAERAEVSPELARHPVGQHQPDDR